jgi:DHA2 family methylenomycin A resistance protein-like MFS transporter
MTAAIGGANVPAAKLARTFEARRLIAAGVVVMACACAALLGSGAHGSYASIAAQMVALGSGLGLLVPPMTSSLLGSVDRSRSGLASGTLNSMRQTGSVIGVALFGSLIATSSFAQGLRLALGISVALLAVASVLARGVARSGGSAP